MKTKIIAQKIIFKASPHEIYEALMSSKKHAEFTKSEATISRKVGGKFTAYDGYIEGKNLELVKDHRIVQEWRASNWPEGHVSIATFVLNPVEGGTELIFEQNGVPTTDFKDIDSGWKKYYWEPLKKMLEI